MDRRKELKLQYKEIIHPMGVYQIKNVENGKVFVGSSMNLKGKANSYRSKLEFDSLHHKGLKEDIKAHGLNAFIFETLETIDPEEIPKEHWKEAVEDLEEIWLEKLQPYGERGYNKEKKQR